MITQSIAARTARSRGGSKSLGLSASTPCKRKTRAAHPLRMPEGSTANNGLADVALERIDTVAEDAPAAE